jgi:two-component system, NarL family, nitrate/nitrite response regulator NarL
MTRLITAVIEPNPIFREGLVRVLSEASEKRCFGFGSLNEVQEAAVAKSNHILFVADLGQDQSVVVAGITYLRSRFPMVSIVILSDCYSDGHMLAALRAGADGYLLKFIGCDVLTRSLDLIVLGEHVFPSQTLDLLRTGRFLEEPAKPSLCDQTKILSAREAEVLNCLSVGCANKVIARQFGITEATVKVHVKAILRKIQVKNRTEAAIWARNHGLEPAAIPPARSLVLAQPAQVESRELVQESR